MGRAISRFTTILHDVGMKTIFKSFQEKAFQSPQLVICFSRQPIPAGIQKTNKVKTDKTNEAAKPTYTCAYKGASSTATSLAAQMQADKSGAILVSNGFGKAAFCLFLARLAIRAVEAGYDEKKLTLLFQAMDAGNASAAGKAAASIVIT